MAVCLPNCEGVTERLQDAAEGSAAAARHSSFVSPAAGVLFTWGRGSDGQLGQGDRKQPFVHPNCALPRPVASLGAVVQVACGGGQQGCTAAVTSEGRLFTFGNNYKNRLGLGGRAGAAVWIPTLVEALVPVCVVQVACGSEHMLCRTTEGTVYSWGSNNKGCLGLNQPTATPVQVPTVDNASFVAAEHNYSGVLVEGRIWLWGDNSFGKLGVGSKKLQINQPTQVMGVEGLVASFDLGSVYAGACTEEGLLWMWGYGGHGNLGLGTRKSSRSPVCVSLPADERAIQVACTRGQDGFKGGPNPEKGGNEGPHTIVITGSGNMYTFGTCHKGLLCNLGNKTGAFGEPWDELAPYRVGSKLRNKSDSAPNSSLAVWPPPYDQLPPFVHAVSAHIHCGVVCADGTAWAWGCGSNDGRCGVERFLNMAGDGHPPKVDEMKCYMMGPHPIGTAREAYWPGGSPLAGYKVLQLASSRNHMAAIAIREVTDESAQGQPNVAPMNNTRAQLHDPPTGSEGEQL